MLVHSSVWRKVSISFGKISGSEVEVIVALVGLLFTICFREVALIPALSAVFKRKHFLTLCGEKRDAGHLHWAFSCASLSRGAREGQSSADITSS